MEKRAIKTIDSSQGKYLSSIFLVEKKDSNQRPVINLKSLNQHIPYEHLKRDGINLLKEILKEGDFLCKVDLKHAYFVVPLNEESQNFVYFQWKGKLYQFVCLCFSLALIPIVFMKLMKISVAVMRRLNGMIIIKLLLRNTLIFLLQNLGLPSTSKALC